MRVKPRDFILTSLFTLAACHTETRFDADGFYKVHRTGKGHAVAAKGGKTPHKRLALESSRNVEQHPEDYEVYDIGKTVDRKGRLVAPHQVLRNVPGVHGVTMPDNYQPQPESNRINDAVAEAQQAKDRLDTATAGIQAKLNEINAARQEMERLAKENAELKEQVAKAFGASDEKTMPPTGAPMTPAAQAGQAAADADMAKLAKWGKENGKK